MKRGNNLRRRRLLLQQNDSKYFISAMAMGSFRQSNMNEDEDSTSSDSSVDNDSDDSVSVESISDCSSKNEAPSTDSSQRSNTQHRSSNIATRTSRTGELDFDLSIIHGHGKDDGNDSENRPPTPWGSSSSKKRIIAELKDENSNIHNFIGQYTSTDFHNVNFSALLLKFAGNKYNPNLFKGNMKRLLVHLLNKTGPFKGDIEGGRPAVVEKWYTSPNNVSKAYDLLFSLHMNPTTFRSIDQMSAEEIWKSSPLFQQYELNKFKEHLKKMSKRTKDRKHLIQQEHDAFLADMLAIPPKSLTSRGYPFWYTHPACDLLEEDEIGGNTVTMKPKELWKSRKEYQDFPLDIFRKHIYQLRTKRLAAPYWQFKRNKTARKQYEKDIERMTSEWNHVRFEESMEDVIARWNAMSYHEN